MTTSNPGRKGLFQRGLRAPFGVAFTALLCLMLSGGDTPAGTVYASATCSSADPGDGDYCASYNCGPCAEGEGDCDPGQCQAGLECVEEGADDHCRAVDDTCSAASPGASDYCSTSRCGLCDEGEGDCDPGQCQAGLECVEEGAVDRCRAVDDGYSNFQVKLDGVWKGICCNDGRLEVSDGDCWWTESAQRDRVLIDESANREMDCPEGSPTDCDCDGWGEPMHGINGWEVSASLSKSGGGPIYSDEDIETCVYVKSSGELATKWTDSSCPSFRLQ